MCVMNCVNVLPAFQGHCDSACYPSGPSVSTGDWNSRTPTCLNGLTWRNRAEAEYDGGPDQCITDGVCVYGSRDGENMTYWPTTGGNGASVSDAAANTALPDGTSAAPYAYNEALAKSLIYYDSHISGAIEGGASGGSPAKRLAWRGDSCLNCTGSYGEDLSKGYYESGGSTMKLGVVMNFQASVLAWSGVRFAAGYESTGRLAELKWKVKHVTDYLLSCLVSTDPPIYMGSYGNSTQDFDNYAPPEYFERYRQARPAGYLTADDAGSEVTGGAAAALAAASVLFQDDSPDYAARCLSAAETLYSMATASPKSFADSSDPVIQDMQYLYRSDGHYEDELAWAATWLAKATNNSGYDYLSAAASWLSASEEHTSFEVWQYAAGANVLLCETLQELAATGAPGAVSPDSSSLCYTRAHTFFDNYLGLSVIPHTDAGAAIPYHWTGLQHAGHVAFLGLAHALNPAVAAADADYAARLVNYGQFQTNYVLGAAGRSWMVGFGSDYPTYTWHKPSFFSTLTWTDDMGELIWMGRDIGPWSTKVTDLDKYVQRAKFKMEGSQEPNSHIAYGMVFAAPLMNDGLIMSRRDFSYAESTVVSNTGFVGAFAGFSQYYSLGPYDGLDALEEVTDIDYAEILANEFAGSA